MNTKISILLGDVSIDGDLVEKDKVILNGLKKNCMQLILQVGLSLKKLIGNLFVQK